MRITEFHSKFFLGTVLKWTHEKQSICETRNEMHMGLVYGRKSGQSPLKSQAMKGVRAV